MPYNWYTWSLNAEADGTNYAFNVLNNPGYETVRGVPAGTEIIRARVQAQVVIGMQIITPGTYQAGAYIAGGNRVEVGLHWAGPSGASIPPPPPDQNPGDGFWLMRSLLQLQHMNSFSSAIGDEYHWAVYNLPASAVNTEAGRGKQALGSEVDFIWSFDNPLSNYWTVNSANLLGLISATFRVDLLLKT